MAFTTYVLVFAMFRLLTTKSFVLQTRSVAKCMRLKTSPINKSISDLNQAIDNSIQNKKYSKRNPFTRQQVPSVSINEWNKVIDEKLFYADKTEAIMAMANSGNFLKLTAVEGTGKTLFCQQLACYYDKHTSSQQFSQLFDSTRIGKVPTADRTSYLILHLNFDDIILPHLSISTLLMNDDGSDDSANLLNSFRNYINTKLSDFYTKYEQEIKSYEKPEIDQYDHLKSFENILKSIWLGSCSYRIYLIIDNYDSLIYRLNKELDSIMSNQYYEQSTSTKTIPTDSKRQIQNRRFCQVVQDIVDSKSILESFTDIIHKNSGMDTYRPIRRFFMTGTPSMSSTTKHIHLSFSPTAVSSFLMRPFLSIGYLDKMITKTGRSYDDFKVIDIGCEIIKAQRFGFSTYDILSGLQMCSSVASRFNSFKAIRYDGISENSKIAEEFDMNKHLQVIVNNFDDKSTNKLAFFVFNNILDIVIRGKQYNPRKCLEYLSILYASPLSSPDVIFSLLADPDLKSDSSITTTRTAGGTSDRSKQSNKLTATNTFVKKNYLSSPQISYNDFQGFKSKANTIKSTHTIYNDAINDMSIQSITTLLRINFFGYFIVVTV